MSQYYNPQGNQAYPGAVRQQMPYSSQGGYQPMPPSGAGMPGGMGMPGGGMPGGGMPGGGMAGGVPGMLPLEQSYIENILRLNKGKLVHVFTTFENNSQWNAKEFTGIIEAAGRDHLILSDPQTGKRYLIPMVHLDYVTFDEEVEYEPPFGGGQSLGTYPPR
jgi:spore germination protein Q